MAVSTRSVARALAAVVGTARVVDRPEALAGVAVDGVAPRWLVRPMTQEHAAAVVALAGNEGLAVSPRGAGTALDLGHPPARVDVVLDTRDLDRLVDDKPDDLTLSVEAGMTAGALAAHLAARRQWLPVDPPGWQARTLGGLVATNAHGPLRTRYGTLRDLLLGVRFVQADGVLTWGGARVVKSVTGYDIPKLIVGSLGSLGVVSELTLRLQPMPAAETTWLAAFDSAGAGCGLAVDVLDSSIQPNRLELLNEPALRACSLPPGALTVAIAIGSAKEAVLEQGEMFQRLADRAGGRVTRAPGDVWARYDHACAKAEGEVVLQVSSLTSRLAETIAAVERAHARHGSGAAMITGAAALGTLRVTLTGAELDEAASLVAALREHVGAFDGSAIVLAAPRALRERVDPWGPVAAPAFALMRAIKDEFDPARVLNPGRFVGGL